MEKESFRDDCEADTDRRYSSVKPIGDNLRDLHIYCDDSDDMGMSDDEDTHESGESEESNREEHEEISHQEILSDKLKGCAVACSTSSPDSAELVSAIKGSRERQGSSPRELRVTWAPDVYEPTPTKLQDIVSRDTKQQKVFKKEKMVEKEGQKGKESSRVRGSKDSARAGGGKDKKKKQNHRANARGSKSREYQDYGYADDY